MSKIEYIKGGTINEDILDFLDETAKEKGFDRDDLYFSEEEFEKLFPTSDNQ